jgi:hypothetical protein
LRGEPFHIYIEFLGKVDVFSYFLSIDGTAIKSSQPSVTATDFSTSIVVDDVARRVVEHLNARYRLF